MASDLTSSDLLSKWSTPTGSRLKSSLLSSSFTTSLQLQPERKRKPSPVNTLATKKKPLYGEGLTNPTKSAPTTSSVLQSSLLSGGVSTSHLKSSLSSSLQNKSSLSSSLQSKSSLSSSLQSKSYVSSSLGSSQLTKYGTSTKKKEEKPHMSGTLTSASILSSGLGQKTSLSLSSNLKSTLLSSSTSPRSIDGQTLRSSLTGNLTSLSAVTTTFGTKAPARQSSLTASKPKDSKVVKKGTKRAADKDITFQKYQIKAPKYDLSDQVPDVGEISVKSFVSPVDDLTLNKIATPLHDINGFKLALINAVSGSLICQPNFKDSKDLTRVTLTTMSTTVVNYDPEFILKVALYTRKQLNIRTTANFLLALSANITQCRPFLKKYYCASIALPSDWIEVAEIYQAFHDRTINQGSLPAALRKVMKMKFPNFDKYQLAKYNKESSKKKKKKVEKKTDGISMRGGRGRGRGAMMRGRGAPQRGRIGRGGARGSRQSLSSDSSSSDSDSDDEDNLQRQISDVVYDEDKESDQQLTQMRFSLKQLIRKIHITEPVEHVMCLIGKKYPATLEEFYKARLPGTWEEERAGKRMKLPVPETWETQVSLKGNKASTWETLIDHKKLPFMAMLRNLRNLIRAGISQKHHNMILRRLTDEHQVVNSKQFPFRFFSAYEVLGQLEKEYEKSQKDIIQQAEVQEAQNVYNVGTTRGKGRGRGRGRGGENQWWLEKRQKKLQDKKKAKETEYDLALITRYRKALDTAVKIATVYNVYPIRGHTIVLCDTGPNMAVNCTAARGLGKPRQMIEVALLLGLMCKYSCEECDFVTFNDLKTEEVDVQKGTILDNLEKILERQNFPPMSGSVSSKTKSGLPESVLMDALRDRVQIDNVLILSGGDRIHDQQKFMSAFLKKYREIVNPNLLYVNISFAGKNCGFSESIKPEHDNDIYISGFSDQILRFIAERGEGGQLTHVEKIDDAFNLKTEVHLEQDSVKKTIVKPETPLPVKVNIPRWRTARVFISSTFRDMHGERDVLTRFVFPELRALGKKHFINVHEVDLRWGITEEETRTNQTLDLCLSEIKRCQFFIGLLGERYGYTPQKYTVPDTEEWDWVKSYPKGASITELEMHLGALACPQNKQENAFFYIRDSSFEKDLPKRLHIDFLSENDESKTKLDALKKRVRNSGLEVYDEYPCQWGGVVDTKPCVAGLEQFAVRVLNNMWNAIQKQYPDEDAMLDEFSHVKNQHDAMLETYKNNFVGRKTLVKSCLKHIQEMRSGIITLVGKAGTGKSAFLAALVHSYIESKFCDSASSVLVHMVGAAPGSTNILASLRHMCYSLRRQFGLQSEVPEDFKNITQKFGEMVAEAGQLCGSPLLIFFDGIDLMENSYQPLNMEWLPNPVPENVIFVMTALDDGKCHNALKRRKALDVVVGGLDMWEKADVVRSNLAAHRKALDESPFNNQMKFLLAKREASNPLFLKLACDELRVFGVFENITSKVKSLPQTTPLLLQDILNRLESDLGQNLVTMALTLLVCARRGLEAEELHDLLSLWQILGDTKYTQETVRNVLLSPDQVLAPATFSYLKRSLQSFLNPSDKCETILSLAHADIYTVVKQRYMKGSVDQEQNYHRLLAGYFYSLADPEKDNSFTGNNTRAFSELPYHLSMGADFKSLGSVLCNLNFIHNKCKLGLGGVLLEDYQEKVFSSKTQEREQTKLLSTEKFQQYKMFVSRQLHILNSHPSLTWQQAVNEPSDSEPAKEATRSPHVTGGESYIEWNSKPNVVDPNYLTLSNLPQPVTCVDVTSDNSYFACGGMDCLVRLYSFSTGKELRSFRGHSDVITDVCFAGKTYLCSSSLDNSISIWHVEDGHRVHLLKGHNRRVQSCASDPSAKHLATASWDCTVKIWTIAKGEKICDFKTGSPVNCVAFHPEGQLIVTGSWDATIKIWDIFHKTRKAVLRGHQSSVRDVAYSPSGRHIASAALDGDVKLWAAQNGTQVGNITGHAQPINRLKFSPTGKELITVSDDHKVKVWSGHLGRQEQCLGKEEDGPARSVALSPEGDAIAVGYHEGFIRVYDTLTGLLTWEKHGHKAAVRCITYTTDGKYIIAGSDDCLCQGYSAADGRQVATFGEHMKPVLCVTASVNYLAIGMEDCQCQLFPLAKTYSASRKVVMKAIATMTGQVGPITSCSFSPDGRKLATASRDCSVFIWDVQMSQFGGQMDPLQKLHSCHADWITDCKWSNIGDFLVTSSTDFNLKVWDVKTGTEKYKMTGHMSSINSIAYQYGCVVSSSSDGSVKVWSHKGTEITTLYGHTQSANCCDMLVKVSDDSGVPEDNLNDWGAQADFENTDGKSQKKSQVKMDDVLVVSCGDDGTVRLWKPLQANEMANLTGHSDRVISVATDSHSNLCTSSLDRSVRLWKPQLSSEKAVNCHDAEVTFLACSPNQQLVVTGSRDGVLKLWTESDDSHVKTCLQTLKAHSKSVNTGCFLTNDLFVTGGDDATIYVWTIVKKENNPFRFRKARTHQTNSPVTSIVMNSITRAKSGHVFFSAEWDGVVKAWNTDMANCLAKYQATKEESRDWLLKLHFYDENSNYLAVTTSNQIVVLMNTGAVYMQRDECYIANLGGFKGCVLTLPHYEAVDKIPVHKQRLNMVLDMCGNNNKLFCADSSGKISISSGTQYRESLKVHSAPLSCIQTVGDLIFTASHDRTIKVWKQDEDMFKLKSPLSEGLEQVGLFFCSSPVTSLTVTASSPKEVHFMYGDKLGNVHFLTWKN